MLHGAVLLPPEVREQQRRRADILGTDRWREELLGFFTSIAGAARERVRADISAAPRVYAEPMLRDIASSDSAAELTALRCPLMYVHSQMPTDLTRLRALRPDAIIEEIPGAGHYQMLTAPGGKRPARSFPGDGPLRPSSLSVAHSTQTTTRPEPAAHASSV